MNLTWLLLILAVVLIGLGALRFDMLVARWRELMGQAPAGREPPPTGPLVEQLPENPGLHPHATPARKPGYHRSGKRH